ncbi:MAG: hypothetical protein ACOX7P_02530 [Oscillospiraceae bacterium]|jgi:hypothetical protein
MQKLMRGAVVTVPAKVEIVDDIPVPVPRGYEALVKEKSCGCLRLVESKKALKVIITI